MTRKYGTGIMIPMILILIMNGMIMIKAMITGMIINRMIPLGETIIEGISLGDLTNPLTAELLSAVILPWDLHT